jgi:putative FmdB family regulatory protein
MPIFEYICQECDRPFEQIVPRHDSIADCPYCKSVNVEKQLSVFAVSGGSSSENSFADPGCGHCGAAQPGMCRMED